MENNKRSRIALGTVQFGMDYGISRLHGQTPVSEVSKILAMAKQAGVSLLDTAYTYGNCEKILGEQEISSFDIVSKIPIPGENSFEHYLNATLSRLKLDTLYGYMAHQAKVLTERPEVWMDLKKAKAEGKIRKIGYSLYDPEELEQLLSLDMHPDIIQVPYNILDRRFEPKFAELKSTGVEIHVRSAFLQGLFFTPVSRLSDFFDPIKPFLTDLNVRLETSAHKASYLLHFALRNQHIDKVVIGVHTAEQFRENLDALSIGSETPASPHIQAAYRIINPAMWPKR